MTIAYNHLNLPKLFTFANGAQSNTIEVLYDAAGTKLRKTVKTGTTTNYTQDYIGGIEYRDGARETIYTAVPIAIGRVFYNSGTPRYEYSINPDSYREFGNARLSFTDKDNNGVVDVTANPATNEILQENHYYLPSSRDRLFGLNTSPDSYRDWMNDASLDNKYQYNSIEFNEDFGLNMNLAFFRSYDPALGRWLQTDPRMNTSLSSYLGFSNNPILFSDTFGDTVRYEGGMEDYVKQFTSRTITNKKNGKEKTNRKFNQAFADLVGVLEASDIVYNFTDDASKMSGKGGAEMSHDPEKDNQVNITIPEGAYTELGGRAAALMEETFHAGQVESGDIWFQKQGGKWKTQGLDIGDEYSAKKFAADSGFAFINYSDGGYLKPTQIGVVGSESEESAKVFLLKGGDKAGKNQDTGSTKNFHYNAAYPGYSSNNLTSPSRIRSDNYMSNKKN